MKSTKEMIEVMQAYESGEQIQVKNTIDDTKWKEIEFPGWDWIYYDYRVKPKSNYIPFETAEEFLAAQRKHGENVRCKLDDELYHAYINNRNETVLISHYGHTGSIMINIVNMYDKYEFVDGTPCGKEVEV